MARKKVLLLNPPADGLKVIKDQYCSFTSKTGYYWIPIDLLMLSGDLAEVFDVTVVDSIVEELSDQETEERIVQLSPDHVIVLSSVLTHIRDRKLISGLKATLDFTTTFIGDLFYFEPEKMIEYPEVDSVIYEYPCSELVEYIQTGSAKNNIIYKKKNRVVHCPLQKKGNVCYRTPRHDIFQLEKYSVPFMDSSICTSLVTNFGCRYSCNYCPASSVNYSNRSLESIIAELDYLEEIGIQNFWMRDFTFGLNTEVTDKLLQYLKIKKFSWFCLSRSEVMNEKLIVEMRASGCNLIMLGVDITSGQTMDAVNRKQDLDGLKKKVKIMSKNNIQVLIHVILGMPGESFKMMLDTVNFISSTQANYLSINFFSPRVGTKYFDCQTHESESSQEFDSYYAQSKLGAVPTYQLHYLKMYALFFFYFRPTRIVRILRQLTNIKQFLSVLKTGIKIFT